MVVPYLPPKTLVGRNQKLNNYPRPGGHEGIQNLEGKKMERIYTSCYGKLVKRCPGLHEYWFHGKLIATGSSLSSPNPEEPPTKSDWDFCVSLLPESQKEA